ncbi:MAG: hypothetical protein J6M94_03070 [Prevotella sp.]|nr:hypothetical protein [Prevotella sp.]MBP3843198.1 hypothetical protein [Prevotella sp.]
MSTIKRSGNTINLEVSVFVYKDLDYPNGDMYIAYCPELDLAGYDTTNRKARKSFEVVLKDYIDYTTEKGTLESDLLKHGWRKFKDGKIAEPTYVEMLKRSQLKSVLSQKRLNKYSVPVLV